jgi:hypothetical protein
MNRIQKSSIIFVEGFFSTYKYVKIVVDSFLRRQIWRLELLQMVPAT